MSAEESIRAGGVTLAFDTNAIIGRSPRERRLVFGGFFTICDIANRLRDEAPRPLEIHVVVPALARLEALYDLRIERGKAPFDEAFVKSALEGKARVIEFNDDAAIRASGVLLRWFDCDEAWQRAKRERCLEALGLGKGHPASGRGLASIDWAIAAQAEAEGWILVTRDTRAEFQHVSHTITKEALRELLDRLLEERGLSSDKVHGKTLKK